MSQSRRAFLKHTAACAAAAAAGIAPPTYGQNLITDRSATELKWSKAPCRFCGTGCGVNVGVKSGRVVPRMATCMHP